MINNKSVKVGKNLYKAPRPKRRIALNVYQSFCVVQHKNRWVVAFAEDSKDHSRAFKSCQTINRTQAINLINFLSDFVNLVKPTQATALHASIKASSNRITRAAHELTGIAVGQDSK